MGERYFSKVQYGKETVRGTAVAATKYLMGVQVAALSVDRKPRAIAENIGIRAEAMRMVVDQYQVKEALNIQDGYFQALPLLFGCGLKGGVVAAETTPAQADYLWNFTPSLAFNVFNAPDSFTLEKGDDLQAYEAEYCMLERIKISGSVAQGAEGAPVAIECDLFGRQWTSTTFTGALSLPSVTQMNAKLARLYLDTSWAGLGSTELTNSLRAFEIDILTGVHPTFSGSGSKYFNKYEEGVISAMLTLTLEGKSAANTLYNAFKTDPQVLQVAQIQINGPQIGTGATHNLSIGIGGVWDEIIPLGGEDRGNNLHTAVLHGLYDPTGAKMLDVKVTTNSNAY
jgi:hypothetical protein